MRLSVTTPQGSLVEAEADEVTAPGVLGEFGVLPGHVPFLSALQPGVFVFRASNDSRVFAVSEGVLEVARKEGGGDKVLVLVSDALQAEEIDRDAAEKELARADAELAHWNKELGGEYKALLTQRAWAAARIAASTRVSAH
jgi:F-type H+-transporting ATPase subunit epsilon